MPHNTNKVILIGTCGSDPKVDYLSSGDRVTSISVKTNDNWIDKKTGKKQERTEWHNIAFTDCLGEFAGKNLKKDLQVTIMGQLRTEKVTNQNGCDCYITKINADVVQIWYGRAYTESALSKTKIKFNRIPSTPISDSFDIDF